MHGPVETQFYFYSKDTMTYVNILQLICRSIANLAINTSVVDCIKSPRFENKKQNTTVVHILIKTKNVLKVQFGFYIQRKNIIYKLH